MRRNAGSNSSRSAPQTRSFGRATFHQIPREVKEKIWTLIVTFTFQAPSRLRLFDIHWAADIVYLFDGGFLNNTDRTCSAIGGVPYPPNAAYSVEGL